MYLVRKEIFLMACVMIVGIFMMSNQAVAQERTEATLSGKVVDDSTEQSLSGVEVNLEGMDESTTTDSEGNYRFDTLQAGNYTVTVEAEGYESWEKEVEIAEESKTLDIRLKPDQ